MAKAVTLSMPVEMHPLGSNIRDYSGS
jgi:hypothetical protein